MTGTSRSPPVPFTFQAQNVGPSDRRLSSPKTTFITCRLPLSQSFDISKAHGTLRSVEAELRRLIGEEESSGLRMERNMLIEQVRLHAHEWSRHTLAESLLTLARQKFERERQPGVVRHAERFFSEITDGRYHQGYAPLGEQTITVTDHTGGGKKPSELSRGTREQLFLALRFGLVLDLDKRAEPLPVVVDEVLVNFDPARALRTALAFVELSQTNQVLAFTCHPLMVEQFQVAAVKAGAPEPQIIEL
jgi:uncharacterized protein YhaN